MINVHTHDRFVRKDPRRGDREFFVAGVQPDLQGRGGVITLVYRDTGFLKRVKFEAADKFFATAERLTGPEVH